MAAHLGSDAGGVVYLCGPRPGGDLAGWHRWRAAMPAGWREGSHYLDGYNPILRYQHDDGRRVEFHLAREWWAGEQYTPSQCRDAWAMLAAMVRREWKAPVPLWGTPASTGRDLWLRTIPEGEVIPTLPDDLCELIRTTGTQGRTELVAAGEHPALFAYDMRFAYSAFCDRAPTGPVRHDNGSDYLGYTKARYRVAFRAPADWPTVGILPALDADGWSWPTSGEGWCDGAEVHVAIRAGWHVEIRERLYWPESGRPLDLWATRLQRLFRAAQAAPAPYGGMIRAALRAILLHSIGAFQGRPHRITKRAALDADAPDHARIEGDSWVWNEPTATKWSATVHPEWCAHIWARCRTRLLTGPGNIGALHFAPGTVVGFRTDAVFTNRRYELPPDTGGAGRYRCKVAHPNPITITNHVDLIGAGNG